MHISFKIAAIAASLIVGGVSTHCYAQDIEEEGVEENTPFLVATDYMPADGKTDVADAIERLIAENPNRTIHFPDGVYLLSRSIQTPADPAKSVHLVLDNYAILRAAQGWQEGTAVVQLGAIHPKNDILTPGSNYGITGGIIDGGGVADGVSVDGGRETRIQEMSIKNVRVGIHVKHGANSGSSDADVCNVNIVGNNQPGSIGLLVEGFDNTFTNMRIYSVHIGADLRSGGNFLRNIHPLFRFGDTHDYESSIGFRTNNNDNWFDFCYSDQFATGFWFGPKADCNLVNCFCFWYNGKVPFQKAIHQEGKLRSIVYGMRIGFHADCQTRAILTAETGGKGQLEHIILHGQSALMPEDVSAQYIKQ